MKYIIGISLLVLIALSIYIIGPKKEVAAGGVHEVVVTEVLQANNYTYLEVKENKQKVWVAVPSMIAAVGDKYYYTGGMVMENFESKDLGRVFDAILFLEQVYQSPPTSHAAAADPSSTEHTGAVQDPKMNFEIDPLEDGISISELYSNKEKYEGKIVKVRGAVTKFNPDIMSLNWIHIQDGTHFEGKYDLTITSDQTVEAGNIVIVEGKVILDKDFGYGYFYEVLMQDAKIIEESNH